MVIQYSFRARRKRKSKLGGQMMCEKAGQVQECVALVCLYGIYIISPKDFGDYAIWLYSNVLWRILTTDVVITQPTIFVVGFREDIRKHRIHNGTLYGIV